MSFLNKLALFCEGFCEGWAATSVKAAGNIEYDNNQYYDNDNYANDMYHTDLEDSGYVDFTFEPGELGPDYSYKGYWEYK